MYRIIDGNQNVSMYQYNDDFTSANTISSLFAYTCNI